MEHSVTVTCPAIADLACLYTHPHTRTPTYTHPAGDRPTDVSQRRLAAAITGASGGRLLGALSLLVAGITSASAHLLPDVEAAAAAVTGSTAAADAGIVAGAAAAALALAWPVLAPFVEVWRFSKLSAPEVEEVVAIKEPLQVRHSSNGVGAALQHCSSARACP